MRVLHLDTGREMRGGQRQVLALLDGLRERGVECRLLARSGGPLLTAAAAAGLRAESWSPWRLWRDARAADLVHAHDARSHAWAAALAGATPVVVSRRVAFPVRASRTSRWVYRRAERFLAVSGHVRERLLEAGVSAERISVVADGVRVPEQVLPPDGRVVALETADPRKGSRLLREAAEAAGVAVVFSRDLERDLPGASLFVYLTWAEGLGSAALAAQAHGVPVLASRVGGLPEAVEENVTGLLIENEAGRVASALRSLASDSERLREMGLRGRRRVQERFTVATMVGETMRVYDGVVGA